MVFLEHDPSSTEKHWYRQFSVAFTAPHHKGSNLKEHTTSQVLRDVAVTSGSRRLGQGISRSRSVWTA